jgi:BlaR1 peptidase M56
MAVQLRTESSGPATGAEPANRGATPAATAASRVALAGTGLGGLGLASSLFVIFRLSQTWRVSPGATSHEFSILGRELSYPAANLPAVVVVVLALIGLVVILMMLAGAVRELVAAGRVRRRLRALAPRESGGVLVFADERPRAFCAGLLTPRVYLSTGALELLDEHALRAVVAHELHHARRRDPLRLAAGRVIARAMFFVPGMRDLGRRQSILVELSADESAIGGGRDRRSALARAMLTFSEHSRADDPTGIDPERVDHLLGDSPSWRFPTLLCASAFSMLALLVALGALAGQVASGSATLAPPFLSRQPCVVVLAALPVLAGLLGLALRRVASPATDQKGS